MRLAIRGNDSDRVTVLTSIQGTKSTARCRILIIIVSCRQHTQKSEMFNRLSIHHYYSETDVNMPHRSKYGDENDT